MHLARKPGLTIFLITALAAMAFAHGGGEHIKGTVTAIGENSITLETPANKSKTIGFDAKTKFEKSGAAATVKDLKVGDRVVVDIHEMGEKLHATVVRFGAPKKAPTSPSH